MMIGLLLLAGLAAAPEDPPLDCENAVAQLEMNLCAGQEYERADAELNRVYRDVIANARELDREVNRQYDQQPSYEETIRKAQRAWVTFREEHCLWESFEARGGSMQPMLDSGCRTTLTRERIKQLQPEPLGQ